MLTFADFRNSPARAFVEGLLRMSIEDIKTWSGFQAAALENRRVFTRPDDDDWRLGFYDTMWERFGTASSGERGLMLAVLHAIDYDALADKLGAEHGRTFFQIIDLADDSYRSAAAACIARLD